ncbi:MAG: hypothetical protein ACI4PQ_02970, partial [Butyricicoccaceae bacterium]
MLSKLIGHELRATRRVFLPAYGAALIFTILTRILMSFDVFRDDFMEFSSPKWLIDLMATISAFLTGASLVAIFVLAFVYMIIRFYRNLLRDEGYLMFTLPVRTSDLIWSKCITSTLWMFATVFVAVIAVFILCTDANFWQTLLPQLQDLFGVVWELGSFHSILYALEGLLFVIFSLFASNMFIYLCLALGQLSSKNRIVLSIAAYIAITTALEFIGVSLMMVIGNNCELEWFGFLSHINMIGLMHLFFCALIVLSIVETLVCALLTDRILTRRLN